MASEFEVFPNLREWPKAIEDLGLADADSSVLRVVSKVRNFGTLADFSKLQDLWCFDINDERFRSICRSTNLRRVFIDGLRTDDLSGLNNLIKLEVLSLDSNSKINDLAVLRHRSTLRGLGIINFKNLHSVKDISTLTSLKVLRISGSMWTRMTLDTLEPLSEMTQLKELSLNNLKATDNSLRALGKLKQLENLYLPNFYPVEEFGWLSSRLKNTKCTWFEPYIDFDYRSCKKCGNQSMVMLSGRGTSIICKLCDNTRLAKHIDKFNKAAQL